MSARRAAADAAHLAGLMALCLQGCVIPAHRVIAHDPPLRVGVGRLIKGTTTREQVLQWFGVPDVRADGPVAVVSPMHPVIRTQREIVTKGRLGDEPLAELARLLPYSSIDSEHEALLYIEHKQTGFIVIPGGGYLRYYLNKLLVFVDKRSGIVDDFFYREEFPG